MRTPETRRCTKRFLEAMYVIMRRDKITMKEFGKPINYAANNIISMRRGDRDVTLDMVLSIIQIYDVSPDWLLEGKGNMFKDKIDLNELTEVFAREVLKKTTRK